MGAIIESKPLTFTILTLHKTFPNLAKGIAEGEITEIDEDFFNRLSSSEEIRVQNAGTFNAVKLYWNVLLFADEIYPTFSKVRRGNILTENSISKTLRFQYVREKRYRELADTKAIERVSFRIRFASSDRLQQIEESVQSIREKLQRKRKVKFDKVVQEVQVKEVQEVKSEGAKIKTQPHQPTASIKSAVAKSVPSVEGIKSSYALRIQKKQEKEDRLNKFYRLLCKLARPADGEPIYRRYGRTLKYFNVYKGQLLYSITELQLKYNSTYHKNENIVKGSTIESILCSLAGLALNGSKRVEKSRYAKVPLVMCESTFSKAAKVPLKVRFVSIRSVGYLITIKELVNQEVWEGAKDPNNTQEICESTFNQCAKVPLVMCESTSLINNINKYNRKKEEIFAELPKVDKEHYKQLFTNYPDIAKKFLNPYTCSLEEYKDIFQRLQKEKNLNETDAKEAFRAALRRINNDSTLIDADFTLSGRMKKELNLKNKKEDIK